MKEAKQTVFSWGKSPQLEEMAYSSEAIVKPTQESS